jgi:apolipoprotein D and lipocalin family protein
MSASLRSVLRRSTIAAVALGGLVAPAAAVAGPVTPVAKLDIQQYLGRWQQIAAIPQWYEAFCYSDTNANYSLNANGTVKVQNRCLSLGGFPVNALGQARIIDKTTNAQLQVSFLNVGGYYYPDNQPNYVVMGLGAGYSWAVVGDPQRTSGFVLARASKITAAEKAQITNVLTANGFNPCSLRTTRQRGGITVDQPFCK